jgi:hypothetical protein
VLVDPSRFLTSGGQVLFGNNTYSGSTTVTSGGLAINGTTSGQGDYLVGNGRSGIPALSGIGTIGFAPDAKLTLSGGQLSPGAGVQRESLESNGIGTLRVQASGSGGVTFGAHSVLTIEVGAAGASDQLMIGGLIDLTASTDSLALTERSGALMGVITPLPPSMRTAGRYLQQCHRSSFQLHRPVYADEYHARGDSRAMRTVLLVLGVLAVMPDAAPVHCPA